MPPGEGRRLATGTMGGAALKAIEDVQSCGEYRVNNIVWSRYPISRVVTRNAGLPMALEWNFERDGEVLQVATRSAQATGEYVVASGYTGCQLRTERYTRYSEYIARVLALDHGLAQQHWTHVAVRETSETQE